MPQDFNQKDVENMLQGAPQMREVILERDKRKKEAQLRARLFEQQLPIYNPVQATDIEREINVLKAEIAQLEIQDSREQFEQNMPKKDEVRIFGKVKRGKRLADRIALFIPEKSDEPIAQNEIDDSGNYTMSTACLKENAEIRIYFGDALLLRDNQPLPLVPYAVYERDYELSACQLGGIDEPKPLMPNVVGMSLREAQQILRPYGLDNISIKETSSTEPTGTVLFQTPTQGEEISSNTVVVLDVSNQQKFVMPDVIGQALSAAEDLIATLPHASLQMDYVIGEGEPGTIVNQTPIPGSELNEATEILLCILEQKDEPSIKFPLLREMPLEQAREILKTAGFLNFDIKGVKEGEKLDEYFVSKQWPEEGTLVTKSVSIILEATK